MCPFQGHQFDHTWRFAKPRSSRKCKLETIEACAKIHGATESDKRPCLDGMWVSLVATASSEQRKYIASSKKVTNVLPSVVNKTVVEFEESTDNSVRSVKVQYCKGLISKEKYKKRQRVCMKSNEKSAPRRSIKFSGMKIPKFFLMKRLFPFPNLLKLVQ